MTRAIEDRTAFVETIPSYDDISDNRDNRDNDVV